MITFLLSQLFGFIIFIVINFSLFCYIGYKRSQAFKVDSLKKPVKYRLGFFALFIFFTVGLSFRASYVYDQIEKVKHTRDRVSTDTPIRDPESSL